MERKVTLEDGTILKVSKYDYEHLIENSIKAKLPESWEDVESAGYHLDGHYNCLNFATKEQAEASTAMGQLSILMKIYNEDWEPDWLNYNEYKYIILFVRNKIQESHAKESQKFLAFKSEKLRDAFLKNFRELIEKAKPLL